MNLSYPDLHHTREPSMDTPNNEDNDDSTKWEFDSLSKESIQYKEYDFVYILAPNNSIAQGYTSQSSLTSPSRVTIH